MLFSSDVFLFGFLPIVLAGYYVLTLYAPRTRYPFLTIGSMCFYGWWDVRYLLLLLVLIVLNYLFHLLLARHQSRALLAAGIGLNLLVLGYFKYWGVIAAGIGDLTGFEVFVGNIVLPLGISFFTFQKIAFLVDTYKTKVTRQRFGPFLLFVLFFPQLIAGPIVHHSELMPQFEAKAGRVSLADIHIGLLLFTIGLTKKVLLADPLGVGANAIFSLAGEDYALSLLEAWYGAISYTLQLYFDFSGYSDMALGLALLFGVRLPVNFFSPYKSASIIEFWRRWHMTLSRFLRDYVYIPLGGNRRGERRRLANLLLTMVIGGIWHGAGWAFVAWGALHGLFLVVNHGWRALGGRWHVPAPLGQALTLLAVVLSWVIFRAADLDVAGVMYRGMVGLGGVSLPLELQPLLQAVAPQWAEQLSYFALNDRSQFYEGILYIAAGAAIALFAPNAVQLLSAYRPSLPTVLLEAHPGPARMSAAIVRPAAAILFGIAFALVVLAINSAPSSDFLYFQF